MNIYQPSFFDDSDRRTALSRLGDPLMELSKQIDFEMFRPMLITDYRVATGSVHDSIVLSEVLGEGDNGQSMHTDSVYKSVECDEILCSMKIENQIYEKGKRGTALTQNQLKNNRQVQNYSANRACVWIHG